MASTIDELAALIDPDAFTAREEDQTTFGSGASLELRRLFAAGAAERVHATLSNEAG